MMVEHRSKSDQLSRNHNLSTAMTRSRICLLRSSLVMAMALWVVNEGWLKGGVGDEGCTNELVGSDVVGLLPSLGSNRVEGRRLCSSSISRVAEELRLRAIEGPAITDRPNVLWSVILFQFTSPLPEAVEELASGEGDRERE